jgi:hypothetical protein
MDVRFSRRPKSEDIPACKAKLSPAAKQETGIGKTDTKMIMTAAPTFFLENMRPPVL